MKPARPKRAVRVEYWQIKRGRFRGQWRWVAKAANNRKVCTPGESFTNQRGMWNNINLIFNQLQFVPFKRVEDPNA